MPFTGGWSPSPERTGGGEGTSDAPLLQRVFESLAAARGRAFDQTTQSFVGAENMALARSITFDLYGSNTRFANEMNPSKATVAGLLPRWERILACPPKYGDTETVRQARCAAAIGRFGQGNDSQAVIDSLTLVLGDLFVGLTLFTPANATVWWPAYGGSGAGGAGAQVLSVSGNQVTVTSLSQVPSSAPGANLVLSNCSNPGNDGTFPIQSRPDAATVVVINNGSPSGADYGIGGTALDPTIVWTMPNPITPWLSTVAHVDVLVNPLGAPGYVNPDGTVNGAFYATVQAMNPILDWLLPADTTFDWYVYGSHGGAGWYLDEPDLDLLIFDA